MRANAKQKREFMVLCIAYDMLKILVREPEQHDAFKTLEAEFLHENARWRESLYARVEAQGAEA